jgi:hypothetical protein
MIWISMNTRYISVDYNGEVFVCVLIYRGEEGGKGLKEICLQ